MKSTYELTVRGYELDSFGHVNNAVYLNYAEAAMWHCLNRYGLVELLQKEGLFPVILESSLRYLHELHLLDPVRIETEMHCRRTGQIHPYRHTGKHRADRLPHPGQACLCEWGADHLRYSPGSPRTDGA